MARRVMELSNSYSPHFTRQGMNGVHHARCYLSGLMGIQRRKNIETIGTGVAGSDYQGMEQFISSSPWSHGSLMDQLAAEADGMIGDASDAGLFIEESGFLKKGKASVGVQHQAAGRAGKIENCQIGIFACLAKGERMALTGFRLFLPESWSQDPERCDKAKIPREMRVHLPKWRQALELVESARRRGMRFGWVGIGSLYGGTSAFINGVEDLGEKFMADVDVTHRIWTIRPAVDLPLAPAGKEGPREHFKVAADNPAAYPTVEEWTARHFRQESREVIYRQGTMGPLTARLWVSEVWTWEPGWESGPRPRLLVVGQDPDGVMKYSLCNLPPGLPWERYAHVQGQRFWVEQSFQQARSQLGMAQYQVRVWQGWHHHMALVCLATLFLLKEEIRSAGSLPLSGCRDLTRLLDDYLPHRGHVG